MRRIYFQGGRGVAILGLEEHVVWEKAWGVELWSCAFVGGIEKVESEEVLGEGACTRSAAVAIQRRGWCWWERLACFWVSPFVSKPRESKS